MLQSTLIPLQFAGDVDDQGEALDRCGVSGSRQAIGESGVGCGLAGSDETRVHFRAALDSWISLVSPNPPKEGLGGQPLKKREGAPMNLG